MANLEDLAIGKEVNSLVLALSHCPAGDKIRENTVRIGLTLGLKTSDVKIMKQKEEDTEIWHDLLSAWVLKEGNNATVIQLYTKFLELELHSFTDILQFKYPNIINPFLEDLENKFSNRDPLHHNNPGGNPIQQKPQNSNGSRFQRTRSSISNYLRLRPFLWIAGTMVLVIMVIVILVISVPGGSNV